MTEGGYTTVWVDEDTRDRINAADEELTADEIIRKALNQAHFADT